MTIEMYLIFNDQSGTGYAYSVLAWSKMKGTFVHSMTPEMCFIWSSDLVQATWYIPLRPER